MPRNCFEGYLTPECAECINWRDGSDGSIGCATHYPIDQCSAFAKVMEQEGDSTNEHNQT